MRHAGLFEEATRRRLVRLCAAISGDRQAAEDLAQETLVEAWRNSHKLHDPSGADRWLAAIARNVCLRWARRRFREPSALAGPEPAWEEGFEDGELGELLDRALALLPAGTRDVLVKRYVDEMPRPEIAARLGISEDAVSMRLTRGKLVLRRVLAQELRDEALDRGLDAAPWAATRVWCPQCGRRKLLACVEPVPGAVAFRCPGCDPEPQEPGVQLPLANPSFAALVASVVRPTAILARLAAFTHRYYSDGAGPVACTRCGTRTTLSPYERESTGPGAHGRGLAAVCRACGEGVCSSLGAIALAQPSVQRLRREQRRIRAQPARTVEVGGSPAVLVRYESLAGSAVVEVLFAANTLRVLDTAA